MQVKRGLEEGCLKRGSEERCWNARFEGKVAEREVSKKGTGKRGLEEGCQKEGFGGRVPESEECDITAV